MGANTSRPTRKLTIDNDDPTSVIKVSDDVVERLKGKQGVRKQPSTDQSHGGLGGVAPLVAPSTFLHEPSLTSLQIRQANLLELKKNDAYWEKRMKDVELKHKKMHEILEEEYNRALNEVGGNNKDKNVSKYLPPCYDNKQKIVDCYKKYPNQALKCAKEVEEFTKCIDFKRSALIENRG